MPYPKDYLIIEFSFFSPITRCTCLARLRFKVVQKPFYTEAMNIKIVRKGDPIGYKGKTSHQNVIYVNFSIKRSIFEDIIKRYILAKYPNVERDQITLRWEKGNQIRFVGED